DGLVVDREAATAQLTDSLRGLRPLDAPLPTLAKPAAVRAADLVEARQGLERALDESVPVTFRDGYWTLSPRDLAGFVEQEVDPTKRGAEAFSLALDERRLAGWLDERLAPEINREPVDAVVGWNEGLVSVEESVDGVQLKAESLAELVRKSFFGDHEPVEAPATITKPTIDSGNLDKLGVATLLGVGTSNYSGSTDGRATNVEVGAYRLNGTLVPPRGEFSFNHAIGVINEENGFVKAQVINGERIGQDIGGGICQVSTTVFRAAYMAGLQMGEWYPHTYRIPFYEYDGWPPGLDASILQPTEDPSTWGDFTFINPSDSWMLVEAWTTGEQVVVNVYGADLGYQVETDGPILGQARQIEPDLEVVDPELEPGTIKQTETPLEGLEVRHVRRVFDRSGTLLREGPFVTQYASRGNVWTVSSDMKGKSPADPNRPLPKPAQPARDEAAMADAAAGAEVVDDVSVVDGAAPVEEPAVPAEE
ncbi:MAG: VanW family protein, partial [Chloroflexota bacterium]|nr:VanW family protein [Chloroflexota bacterium]